MGTRINFEISDSESKLSATLYANSSHTTQFATKVFEEVLKKSVGPTEAVEKLLALRYETAEGNHAVGDRIFWLVTPRLHKDSIEDADLEGEWFARWGGKGTEWYYFRTGSVREAIYGLC